MAGVPRRVNRRLLIEPGMAVVRVRLDDAVLHPAREGGFVDSEAGREFLLGEQPAGAQSIEARAKAKRDQLSGALAGQDVIRAEPANVTPLLITDRRSNAS